jgi:hypothetical protein
MAEAYDGTSPLRGGPLYRDRRVKADRAVNADRARRGAVTTWSRTG